MSADIKAWLKLIFVTAVIVSMYAWMIWMLKPVGCDE